MANELKVAFMANKIFKLIKTIYSKSNAISTFIAALQAAVAFLILLPRAMPWAVAI